MVKCLSVAMKSQAFLAPKTFVFAGIDENEVRRVGEGIRTLVGARPPDLESGAFDHSATPTR